VQGNRNALDLALDLQRAPRSPFVSLVAVETSYVHGRRARGSASESRLEFPEHFYNNFYELTKAMAAIDTERALFEDGLRVVQILPSIIIGRSRTGTNRGDTKVLNAPINAFGRAKQSLDAAGKGWLDRARGWLVGTIATTFPADRSAELNLVPVDRVAGGILAALEIPEAVGARIHLATDDRIRSQDVARISGEELGVTIHMTDPVLTRALLLPALKAVLGLVGEPRLAAAVERLGFIFGVYSEWGQPVHDVGNDVRILGLPARRPDTEAAFRMLCRHNKFVQEFGSVRSPGEIARRERLWEEAVDEIEFESGRSVASLAPEEFKRRLVARIDLASFRPRYGAVGTARGR
jgi:nucleoside-diphosphate-sugar epimerase